MDMNPGPKTNTGAARQNLAPPEWIGFVSLATLRRHWPLLAAFPIVGLLVAAIYLQTASSQWQSQGTLLVGKVGNEPIEPPAEVLTRLKLQSFRSRVLEKLGIDDDDSAVAKLIRDGMQARDVTGVGLIEIRVRGYSPEAAVSNLGAAIELVIADHETRAASLAARIEQRIAEVRTGINAARQDRNQQLESAKAQARTSTDPVLTTAVAAQIISLRDAEIRALNERKYALEDLLKPSSTFPTRLVEAIYVPNRPAYPSRGVALVAGLAIGLAISLVVAILLERSRTGGASRRVP